MYPKSAVFSLYFHAVRAGVRRENVDDAEIVPAILHEQPGRLLVDFRSPIISAQQLKQSHVVGNWCDLDLYDKNVSCFSSVHPGKCWDSTIDLLLRPRFTSCLMLSHGTSCHLMPCSLDC
jgi:hypothetical protein